MKAVDSPAQNGAVAVRALHYVLIAVALGGIIGRTLATDSVDMLGLEQSLRQQGQADWQKRRPFLSANDRSRWCTVRSLVEQGTYQIDSIVTDPLWHSIDIVKHDDAGLAAPGADEGHLYSSKPPLLATLMAGLYWPLYHWGGYSLKTHPHAVGRTLLLLANVLPFGLALAVLSRWVDRLTRSPWANVYVMAAACFGTFLTTFAVTFNNHLPAAIAALFAACGFLKICRVGQTKDPSSAPALEQYPAPQTAQPQSALPQTAPLKPATGWTFAGTGLAAGFAAANELPAAALVAALGAALVFWDWRKTLLGYAPGVLLVAAAYFGTNLAAHGVWTVPYAHREAGNSWYAFQYHYKGQVRESYWSRPELRSPVDRGEPSPARYAWHVLLGHHGIFSLTPMWLLSVGGVAVALTRRSHGQRSWTAFVLGVAALSLVVLGFYLSRDQIDRNYGGVTSGLRWMFWLAPLWLLVMTPAVEVCARFRIGRAFALVLLALSVLSVSYPTWNPWTQPWLNDWVDYLQR